MQLPRSRALAPELIWLEETASTNDALRELVTGPDRRARGARAGARAGAGSGAGGAGGARLVVATDNQTAGRGRLGREWIAPPGQTLAFSMLVRDFGAGAGVGASGGVKRALGPSWLPLIAGSAVRAALAQFLPEHEVAVKWPNDVLVAGQKVSGILSEMLPDGSVIVGIGINTLLGEEALPTLNATSLRILLGEEFETADRTDPADRTDRVLSAVLTEFFALLDLAAAGEQEAIRERVRNDSRTLGTAVRALLPRGEVVEGQAVRLADDGSLVIRVRNNADVASGGDAGRGLAADATAMDAREVAVAAGDIEHLR